jgi:hypothetical protein
MLPQHVGLAKSIVEKGGSLQDLIAARKDAVNAVFANPGEQSTIPLPPRNVGYVNAMKRQNLSSSQIIFGSK